MGYPSNLNSFQHTGFTLIELLITVTIVGILSATAIPTYQDYTRRAYYSEVVNSTHPYKTGVAACFYFTSDLTACDAGTNGIPAATAAPGSGAVNSVTVVDGVITATPNAANGIVATDTYVLTPQVSAGRLLWATSGGGVTKGYATQESF